MTPEVLVQMQNHLISALKTVRSKISMLTMKFDVLQHSFDRCCLLAQTKTQTQSQTQAQAGSQAITTQAQNKTPVELKTQIQGRQKVLWRSYILAEVQKVARQLQSLRLDEHCLLKEVEVCNLRIQQAIDDIVMAAEMGGVVLPCQQQQQQQQYQQGGWHNRARQWQSRGSNQQYGHCSVDERSSQNYVDNTGSHTPMPIMNQYQQSGQMERYVPPYFVSHGDMTPQMAILAAMQAPQPRGGAETAPYGGGSRGQRDRDRASSMAVVQGRGEARTRRFRRSQQDYEQPRQPGHRSRSFSHHDSSGNSAAASATVASGIPQPLSLSTTRTEQSLNRNVPKDCDDDSNAIVSSKMNSNTSNTSNMGNTNTSRTDSTSSDGSRNSNSNSNDNSNSNSLSNSENNCSGYSSDEPIFIFNLKEEPFGASSARERDDDKCEKTLRQSGGRKQKARSMVRRRKSDYLCDVNCNVDDGQISPRTVGFEMGRPCARDFVVSSVS